MSKNKDQKQKKKYIIEKSNPILEAKNTMSLQQMRLFDIYLACINPLDESTKHVSIPLQTISQMIGVELNENAMHKMGRDCMMMYIDLVDFDKEAKKRGAMKLRHMFQVFDVDRKNGVWMVEIEADKDILPYLFDLKEMGYLKYSLWNVLRLKSKVAIKLYEVLKVGYGLKNYTLSLQDLKSRLGVADQKTYQKYKFFKQDVLNRCLEDINSKTDIKVTYEEIRGPGRGRPVNAVRFQVLKNPDFTDPLQSIINDSDSGDGSEKLPKAPEQTVPDAPEQEQPEPEQTSCNPDPAPEHKAEIDYYMEAVPEKVKKSKVFKPEELQEKILAVYPGISISAQMQYLRIATSRYLSRLHTGEKIRSHPKYYSKILQNILEENLLNPPAASITGEAAEDQNQKKSMPGSRFHDFDQRDVNYDDILQGPDPEPEGQKKTYNELLEKIKNMPKKNECE